LYRGINDFKKGYQPRPNVVTDEEVDLDTDSHIILVRWRNCSSQLLNLLGFNDVSQEKHTAEPLVPEPSASEFGLAIAKLKSHKSPGIAQISAEMSEEQVECFAVRFINLSVLFGIRWNCVKSGRSPS
jgi:hypothetical protein